MQNFSKIGIHDNNKLVSQTSVALLLIILKT